MYRRDSLKTKMEKNDGKEKKKARIRGSFLVLAHACNHVPARLFSLPVPDLSTFYFYKLASR